MITNVNTMCVESFQTQRALHIRRAHLKFYEIKIYRHENSNINKIYHIQQVIFGNKTEIGEKHAKSIVSIQNT